MTIIIPTLFKIPRIHQTLLELSNCKFVKEIILIDNTTNSIKIELPKLNHICEGTNTYVNPAWNKGANLAKNNKLCFLNDDVWFDWELLEQISEFITKDKGVIGMSTENYENVITDFFITPSKSADLDSSLKLNLIESYYKSIKGERPLGFGCCFFIHKDNWIEIPYGMKIWAGDEWQFYANPNRNYVINGLKLYGSMASTANDPSLEQEFEPIKYNDMLLIREEIKKGRIDNFLLYTKWDV